MRDKRDIGERLMVADNNVRFAVSDMIAADDMQPPRVDGRKSGSKPTEETGSTKPQRTSIEEPDKCDQRHP